MPGPAPAPGPRCRQIRRRLSPTLSYSNQFGDLWIFLPPCKTKPAPALARARTKVVSFSVVSRNCHPNIHNNINIQFLHQPPGDHSQSTVTSLEL